MTSRKTAVVVLAAGLGTRMKSALPKVMHPLAGRPMIAHLLAGLERLDPDRIAVVVGPDMDSVAAAVAPHPTAVQADRLGTAHAVAAAREALDGFDGDVLVVFGDTPLITPETLSRMLDARRSAAAPALVVLGFRPGDPAAYGRLVVDPATNSLERIVEFKDATDQERAIGLCNSGVMCFDGAHLFNLIDRIGNDNAKGEYYLTDAVALARADGLGCAVVEGDEAELLGINSRRELAVAEAIVQDELRGHALDGGATLTDPATTWLSFDTRIGRDVVIGPNVVFGPGVEVGDGVEIRAFSHIEGARIENGAQIGPFARLRPEARVMEGARVGNFVEVKKATIEPGAKVNHLTYIGDARVGTGANVGAGTITCNYDGFFKGFTDIGAGAFIGSNSALVAPVKIGDGAIVAAGSVIGRDVSGDALALTRADHRELAGWAEKFRKRRGAEKEAAKRNKKDG